MEKESKKSVKKENEKTNIKTVIKYKEIIKAICITIGIISLFISIQYFLGADIFKVYEVKKEVKVTEKKEAYTASKGGRNLTLYADESFKYMDLDKVVTGTYKINNNKYTLIYDKSVCELTKVNNMLTSNCPLVMTNEDNDYMTSKSKKITKILYNVNGKDFSNLTESFLSYINAMPTTHKLPSLKSSRVDSIKDCFSTDNMKTIVCSIDYTVIPNETDLSKSRWVSGGKVVKGAIKKFHYVTFENNNGVYKYKSATSSL